METAGWRPVMGKMTLQIVMDAGSTREGGSYRGGRVPLNDVRAGPCSLGQSKRAQSLAQRTAPTTRRTTREEAKQAWRTWIPRAGKWLLRICVEQCAGGEGCVRRVRRILVWSHWPRCAGRGGGAREEAGREHQQGSGLITKENTDSQE